MTARCLNPGCAFPGGMLVADGFILCSDCFAAERQRYYPNWGGQNQRYHFDEMEIGDIWVFARPRTTVAPAATQYGNRHDKRFSVYRDEDNPETHCRVTRLS